MTSGEDVDLGALSRARRWGYILGGSLTDGRRALGALSPEAFGRTVTDQQLLARIQAAGLSPTRAMRMVVYLAGLQADISWLLGQVRAAQTAALQTEPAR